MSSGQSSASSRALRWFPWAAIAVLLAVRLCHEWFGPDIWYHLALGGRIARAGSAQPADNLILQQPGFVNVYWLFQLLVRGMFALDGLVGVSALFIACWCAAFACWLRTTGAARSMPWGVGLALAAVLVCQTRFEERPEVFSFLFLALQINALARWDLAAAPRRNALVSFTLVQVLWSNVHGYFVFGPLLVAAKLVGVAVGTPRADWSRVRPAWRGLWLLAVLTVAATLISPFGLRNWGGVLTLWNFFGVMRREVQEFLPPTGAFMALWTVKLFWLGWAATLLAALYVLFAAARREAFALLLAAAGLWLSATSFRNIPLLVFLSAPLTSVVLQRLTAFRPFEKLGALAVGAAALGFALGAVTGAFGPSSFGIRESPSASPIRFADYLRTDGFHGTLFNHPADGGYLEFYFPALRLYGDSRYVDAEPVRKYFAALRRPEAFRQLDERHHFDAALFKITESRAVLRALANDPRWRLAYADLHRALLVNLSSPAGAAARVRHLAFYRGEDLTVHVNGESALQWAVLFAEANDPDDLLRVLHALGAAPRIPAAVIETGLRYGLAVHNASVLAAARMLRPKMIVAKPADAEVIDRLLSQAAVP
jgi:hypothetical protein